MLRIKYINYNIMQITLNLAEKKTHISIYAQPRDERKRFFDDLHEVIDNIFNNNNNTYFDHKPQHKYAFNKTRGQKSMIDFVITKMLLPSQILDVRTLTS